MGGYGKARCTVMLLNIYYNVCFAMFLFDFSFSFPLSFFLFYQSFYFVVWLFISHKVVALSNKIDSFYLQ